MNMEGSVFNFAQGGTLSFKYASSSLPIAHAKIMKPPSTAGYRGSIDRLNISMAQEELLLWHSILGHYNMYNTQQLMIDTGVDTDPVLCPKEPGISRYSLTLCTSYLRGKGRATSVKRTTELLNPEHFDAIKDGDLLPVDIVSTNQY